MPDAFIPTLAPYGLDRVPGYDASSLTWRQEWQEWREGIYVLRDELSAHCQASPAARQDELALCAEDPARWLALWAWVEEPRPRDGEDQIKPFAPFAFQVDLMQWAVERSSRSTPADGYISKARGLGASWIMSAIAYWAWLFKPWRIKMVSRKEDLVDKPLDLDSLFGKIDFLMAYTPMWMIPAGFKRDEHRLKLMLKNPVSGAQITGESTSAKTARGARATLIIYDEAAFMMGFKDIWATGSGTTDHRFGISSESFEEGSDWYDAWNASLKAAPDSVKELDWFHNPYFDEDWYEEEKARWVHDPEGFAREVERNPYAGWGTWVYPTSRELAVVQAEYDPSLPLLVGIDPGHADDTAIVWGQPRWEDGQRGIVWLGSYERNLLPAEWYAHILTGIEPEPGDECYGIPLGPRERTIMEFFGSLPWSSDRVKYYMDPAGAQKHSGISFFDILVKKSAALRRRRTAELAALGKETQSPKPIAPLFQALKGVARFHDERRNATRRLLQKTQFADNPSARRIQEAMSNYRFSEPGDKSTGEPKPLHNQHSHVVTAVEYVCSYVAMGLAEPAKPKKPKRIKDKLSGRWIEPVPA